MYDHLLNMQSKLGRPRISRAVFSVGVITVIITHHHCGLSNYQKKQTVEICKQDGRHMPINASRAGYELCTGVM